MSRAGGLTCHVMCVRRCQSFTAGPRWCSRTAEVADQYPEAGSGGIGYGDIFRVAVTGLEGE